MGLVQLFREWPCREFPCPDVFARYLLELALEDFRETGHHYLMHLLAKRDGARQDGNAEAIAAVDTQIHEHTLHEQIPQRWHLDFLFSQAGYQLLGEGLLPFWACSLIEICTLEQYWESVLFGLRPQNPALLAGFHAEREVFDTDWLQDARRTWSEEIRLPLEPVERWELAHGHRQAESVVADSMRPS